MLLHRISAVGKDLQIWGFNAYIHAYVEDELILRKLRDKRISLGVLTRKTGPMTYAGI